MESFRRAKTEKSTEGFAYCFLRLQWRHEFLPQRCMGNKEYYLEVMLRLSLAIRQKCIELWKN